MNNKPNFGFYLEYVPDIEAAKKFYVDVLGLEVQRAAPTFVQFDHFAIASDESMSGTNDPEVYWVVEDAEASLRVFSKKTEISQPIKNVPFGKVFSVKNTAGRPIYFVEFAKQRPSLPAYEMSSNLS